MRDIVVDKASAAFIFRFKKFNPIIAQDSINRRSRVCVLKKV